MIPGHNFYITEFAIDAQAVQIIQNSRTIALIGKVSITTTTVGMRNQTFYGTSFETGR